MRFVIVPLAWLVISLVPAAMPQGVSGFPQTSRAALADMRSSVRAVQMIGVEFVTDNPSVRSDAEIRNSLLHLLNAENERFEKQKEDPESTWQYDSSICQALIYPPNLASEQEKIAVLQAIPCAGGIAADFLADQGATIAQTALEMLRSSNPQSADNAAVVLGKMLRPARHLEASLYGAVADALLATAADRQQGDTTGRIHAIRALGSSCNAMFEAPLALLLATNQEDGQIRSTVTVSLRQIKGAECGRL